MNLTDTHTYQVFVMATDEAATCALISAETTVDATPPVEGKLGVGPDFNMVNRLHLFGVTLDIVLCPLLGKEATRQ